MPNLQELIQAFWNDQYTRVQTAEYEQLFPLARLKKVMRTSDLEFPYMISQEAPLLFMKACELFILEITMRAWAVTEEQKRRTLQKGDVRVAIVQSDMYDFLIDIVPREEQFVSNPYLSMFPGNISYGEQPQ